MGVFRKPVSQRRSVKSRKPYRKVQKKSQGRSVSAYRPINNRVGTNPANLVIHNGIGIPDRFRTKLSWTESIILTGFGTAITQTYPVGMNNPYDPQSFLGGNQPAYFDQLIALYKRCVVTGSKMTVTFALPFTATAGDGPYICGINTNSTTGIPTTDVATLVASENTGYEVIQQGGDIKTVTATYSPWSSMGLSKDDTSLFCTPTSGVSGSLYNGHVFASPQGASTTGSVNAIITIEYICEFFNLASVVDT